MEKCCLALDGVFDKRAAQRVQEALEMVKPGGTMDVDLTRIRDFHDVGLGILARTILSSRELVNLDVRGLRDRQHRLLR
jgi:hypothetical protein